MNTAILSKIKDTNSKNQKKELLSTIDQDTKKFVIYALDPFTTFGVTVDPKKLKGKTAHGRPTIWWNKFEMLLQQLKTRELTGNAAKDAVKTILESALTKDDRIWASKVLNKDLKCGFDVNTFCDVFPNEIKPFKVMLANPYENQDTSGDALIDPKFDGVRCTLIDLIPLTRNGRELNGAWHLIEKIDRHILEDFVIDGECCGPGLFEDTVGQARSAKGKDVTVLYPFDMIPRQDWESGKTVDLFSRRTLIEKYLKVSDFIRHVPYERVKDATQELLFDRRDKWIKAGHEGIIWKKNGPYIKKRSNDWLKCKLMETVDIKITGFYEGKGRNKGRLGGFTGTIENTDIEIRCGSGITDKQRKEWYKQQDFLLGKMFEAQYQNKTAKKKLRFPTFIRLRLDKSE